jgi:hypothetical protein
VEFLEVMDLILVFVIAMMTRSQMKVREPLTPTCLGQPLISGNLSSSAQVKDCKDLLNHIVFDFFGSILVRFVLQSIKAPHLFWRPDPIGIEIMHGEEGGRIKVVYMMLFRHVICLMMSAIETQAHKRGWTNCPIDLCILVCLPMGAVGVDGDKARSNGEELLEGVSHSEITEPRR